MNIRLHLFFELNSALAFLLCFRGVPANSCTMMVVFEVNVISPPPSMLTNLMNTYKAQSSAIVHFLWGDNEVADVGNSNNSPAGHDEGNGDILGWVLVAPRRGSRHRNGDTRQKLRPTKTKHNTAKYP